MAEPIRRSWAMHDWIFRTLSVDWEVGEATLTFLPVRKKDEGETAIEIAIEGLSGLTMPRQFDWGSSVSVLDAYSTDIPSGSRLSIQMQSGDLIEVEGAHLHLPVGLMLPNTPTP